METIEKEWVILDNWEVGDIAAVQATNRQALIDAHDWHEEEGQPVLRVALYGEQLGCCGGSVDYATVDDIPYQSVPCPCGNPKHWLIKYEEGNERYCKLSILSG